MEYNIATFYRQFMCNETPSQQFRQLKTLLQGLQSATIMTNFERLTINSVNALVFVAEENVAAAEELLGSKFYTQNENLPLPFIHYFEDEWIQLTTAKATTAVFK
ncbi:hypothetical protein RI129_007490 [Pyrocoelia pectoralis]|uniref:Uncharacterized protein n=1 Tax=Pyrocoelia pectoralis TaxID=417401 RepID=A0AAN7V824_9COLE